MTIFGQVTQVYRLSRLAITETDYRDASKDWICRFKSTEAVRYAVCSIVCYAIGHHCPRAHADELFALAMHNEDIVPQCVALYLEDAVDFCSFYDDIVKDSLELIRTCQPVYNKDIALIAYATTLLLSTLGEVKQELRQYIPISEAVRLVEAP